MGKEKYQKQIEDLFRKSPVVDSGSISRIINKEKKVKQYAKQLIRNLLRKGKIKKLSKGYYTIHDDPSLAVFCFAPAYLGLQDALSFHNLWEQETIPIIITSRKIRQGIRQIIGSNIMIRRIDKRYMLGFEYDFNNKFHLPYSDIEKTYIDMIYFKEKIDKETIKKIKEKINKTKLANYLERYSKKFRIS